MRRAYLPGLFLALLPLAQGCSLQKIAIDTMAPVFVKTRDDFNRGTVPRYAREAGPGLLALINGMILGSPDNVELRLLQAELNMSFAFAFLEQEDPIWATDLYRKAQAAALIALGALDTADSPTADLAKTLPTMSLTDLSKALPKLRKQVQPAIFWWAFARGAEVNLNRGDPKQVADVARVDIAMEWALEQDPAYFNGGPHLYFGMRYLSLPKSLGGVPEKGLKHLVKVDELTKDKHLLAKVMRAQFYAPSLAATPAGAKAKEMEAAAQRAWKAYFGGLEAVLKAPDDLWPDQALLNAVAKQRARVMLADPEAYNIIPPEGAKNPYAKGGDGQGDDDDDDDDWEDGDAPKKGDDDDDDGDWDD